MGEDAGLDLGIRVEAVDGRGLDGRLFLQVVQIKIKSAFPRVPKVVLRTELIIIQKYLLSKEILQNHFEQFSVLLISDSAPIVSLGNKIGEGIPLDVVVGFYKEDDLLD